MHFIRALAAKGYVERLGFTGSYRLNADEGMRVSAFLAASGLGTVVEPVIDMMLGGLEDVTREKDVRGVETATSRPRRNRLSILLDQELVETLSQRPPEGLMGDCLLSRLFLQRLQVEDPSLADELVSTYQLLLLLQHGPLLAGEADWLLWEEGVGRGEKLLNGLLERGYLDKEAATGRFFLSPDEKEHDSAYLIRTGLLSVIDPVLDMILGVIERTPAEVEPVVAPTSAAYRHAHRSFANVLEREINRGLARLSAESIEDKCLLGRLFTDRSRTTKAEELQKFAEVYRGVLVLYRTPATAEELDRVLWDEGEGKGASYMDALVAKGYLERRGEPARAFLVPDERRRTMAYLQRTGLEGRLVPVLDMMLRHAGVRQLPVQIVEELTKELPRPPTPPTPTGEPALSSPSAVPTPPTPPAPEDVQFPPSRFKPPKRLIPDRFKPPKAPEEPDRFKPPKGRTLPEVPAPIEVIEPTVVPTPPTPPTVPTPPTPPTVSTPPTPPTVPTPPTPPTVLTPPATEEFPSPPTRFKPPKRPTLDRFKPPKMPSQPDQFKPPKGRALQEALAPAEAVVPVQESRARTRLSLDLDERLLAAVPRLTGDALSDPSLVAKVLADGSKVTDGGLKATLSELVQVLLLLDRGPIAEDDLDQAVWEDSGRAHMCLSALAETGHVERMGRTGRYVLAVDQRRMTGKLLERTGLRDLVNPVLDEMVRRVRERPRPKVKAPPRETVQKEKKDVPLPEKVVREVARLVAANTYANIIERELNRALTKLPLKALKGECLLSKLFRERISATDVESMCKLAEVYRVHLVIYRTPVTADQLDRVLWGEGAGKGVYYLEALKLKGYAERDENGRYAMLPEEREAIGSFLDRTGLDERLVPVVDMMLGHSGMRPAPAITRPAKVVAPPKPPRPRKLPSPPKPPRPKDVIPPPEKKVVQPSKPPRPRLLERPPSPPKVEKVTPPKPPRPRLLERPPSPPKVEKVTPPKAFRPRLLEPPPSPPKVEKVTPPRPPRPRLLEPPPSPPKVEKVTPPKALRPRLLERPPSPPKVEKVTPRPRLLERPLSPPKVEKVAPPKPPPPPLLEPLPEPIPEKVALPEATRPRLLGPLPPPGSREPSEPAIGTLRALAQRFLSWATPPKPPAALEALRSRRLPRPSEGPVTVSKTAPPIKAEPPRSPAPPMGSGALEAVLKAVLFDRSTKSLAGNCLLARMLVDHRRTSGPESEGKLIELNQVLLVLSRGPITATDLDRVLWSEGAGRASTYLGALEEGGYVEHLGLTGRYLLAHREHERMEDYLDRTGLGEDLGPVLDTLLAKVRPGHAPDAASKVKARGAVADQGLSDILDTELVEAIHRRDPDDLRGDSVLARTLDDLNRADDPLAARRLSEFGQVLMVLSRGPITSDDLDRALWSSGAGKASSYLEELMGSGHIERLGVTGRYILDLDEQEHIEAYLRRTGLGDKLGPLLDRVARSGPE